MGADVTAERTVEKGAGSPGTRTPKGERGFRAAELTALKAPEFVSFKEPPAQERAAAEAYNDAADNHKATLYAAALKQWGTFLAAYPDHSYASSARFYAADAKYHLGIQEKPDGGLEKLLAERNTELAAAGKPALTAAAFQRELRAQAASELAEWIEAHRSAEPGERPAQFETALYTKASLVYHEALAGEHQSFQAAEKAFRELLELAPKSNYADDASAAAAFCCFRQAQLLTRKGEEHADSALAQYRRYLSEYPKGGNSAEAHIGIGRLLAAQGKFDKALPHFHKAAEFAGNANAEGRPLLASAMRLAAIAYLKLEKPQEAAAAADKGLKAARGTAVEDKLLAVKEQARSTIVVAAFNAKDYEGALASAESFLKDYQKSGYRKQIEAIASDCRFAVLVDKAGQEAADKQYGKALDRLEAAMPQLTASQRKQTAELRAYCCFKLGEQAAAEGRYEKARERFDAAAELYPEGANRKSASAASKNVFLLEAQAGFRAAVEAGTEEAWRKAAKAYEAVPSDLRTAAVQHRLGYSQGRAGDLEAMAKTYRVLIAAEQKSSDESSGHQAYAELQSVKAALSRYEAAAAEQALREQSKRNLAAGIAEYRKEEYGAARVKFTAVAESGADPNDVIAARLMRGKAWYAESAQAGEGKKDHYSEAATDFHYVIRRAKDPAIIHDAMLSLAKTYLKLEKPEQAKEQLEKLASADADGSAGKEASSLLKALER